MREKEVLDGLLKGCTGKGNRRRVERAGHVRGVDGDGSGDWWKNHIV